MSYDRDFGVGPHLPPHVLIETFCHDFNNALTGALTTIQALGYKPASDKDWSTALPDIQRCLQTCSELSSLLAHIPWNRSAPTWVDPVKVIDAVVLRYRQLKDAQVRLEVDYGSLVELFYTSGDHLECILFHCCRYLMVGNDNPIVINLKRPNQNTPMKLCVAHYDPKATVASPVDVRQIKQLDMVIAYTLATANQITLELPQPQSIELTFNNNGKEER